MTKLNTKSYPEAPSFNCNYKREGLIIIIIYNTDAAADCGSSVRTNVGDTVCSAVDGLPLYELHFCSTPLFLVYVMRWIQLSAYLGDSGSQKLSKTEDVANKAFFPPEELFLLEVNADLNT